MQPTLNDLIEMARMAGEIVRQGYGKQHDVQLKGEIDLVTEIDRRSEEFLLGALDERFPGQHVIAEESGLRAGVGLWIRWMARSIMRTVFPSFRFQLLLRWGMYLPWGWFTTQCGMSVSARRAGKEPGSTGLL